jgi:hypothetical protein
MISAFFQKCIKIKYKSFWYETNALVFFVVLSTREYLVYAMVITRKQLLICEALMPLLREINWFS